MAPGQEVSLGRVNGGKVEGSGRDMLKINHKGNQGGHLSIPWAVLTLVFGLRSLALRSFSDDRHRFHPSPSQRPVSDL